MADNDPRTVVSLKDYVDTRFSAVDKALGLATDAMNKRLDGMNEFRDALKDQASRLPTRLEVDQSLAAVNTELRQLRDFRVALEAKASQQSVNIALLLAIAGLLISVVKLFAK